MNTQQNLVTLNLSDAQISTIAAALTVIENEFGNSLVTLTPMQKRQASKMGERSVSFCQQTILALKQNRQILPANFDIDDAVADLTAREQLQPLFMRVAQLFQRLSDTDLALGSDVMAAALQGYRQLKISGRSAGLEPLQRELSSRFAQAKRSRKAPPTVTLPTS